MNNFPYLYFLHLAPVDNVATLEASAVVSEGVSRVRNALINGDYLSYDWDSGSNKFIVDIYRSISIIRLYMSSTWLRWYCNSIMSTTCCQFDEVSIDVQAIVKNFHVNSF